MAAQDSFSTSMAPHTNSEGVHVWDSRECAPRRALDVLLERTRASGLPWRSSLHSDDTFWARIKTRDLDKGTVVRFSGTLLEVERRGAEIETSTVEYINLGLVLSGSQELVHDGKRHTAVAGDIVAVNYAAAPHKLSIPDRVETIEFLLRKGSSRVIEECVDFAIIPRRRVSVALTSCFHYLADRFRGEQEANAISEAVLALFPIDAGFYPLVDANAPTSASALFKEILYFINQNLSDPDLTPGSVARHFRISERYVFKLFAQNSARFGDYLTNQRLESIAVELCAIKSGRCHISDVAFRWGFNDLSTFSRAFKRKYGCSANHFRQP